jgi:rare lipoprotein A
VTRRRAAAAAVGALLALTACAGVRRGPASDPVVERGVASWYGPGFHRRRTASGEIYDQHALTAAHRTLAFGAVVEVRHLANDRRVRVRINDRGPFVKGRIIDLSRRAAEVIELVGPGTGQVELRLVQPGPYERPSRRWAVQVGAFTDPARARAFATEMRERLPAVSVVADGVWARVQLGPLADRAAAEALLREVEAGGVAGFVVALD